MGVGKVQGPTNPLKHRHGVTIPLFSLLVKFQDRSTKVLIQEHSELSMYEEQSSRTNSEIHLTFIG